MQSLGGALPGLAAPGAIGGASGVPGPTDTRARSHHDDADLSADGPGQLATGFIHGGSAIPVGNLYQLRLISVGRSAGATMEIGVWPDGGGVELAAARGDGGRKRLPIGR